LNDTSTSVVHSALIALGRSGGDFDPNPVVQLLGSSSESVQIAAAVALARQGRAEGPDALERLAYSRNEHTRLHAAQAMGELASPTFAPTLIRLLDDRHGIRVAALQSLPKVVTSKEAVVAGLSEAERVEAWRRWAGEKK
jgi:HEAT repeat protein